MIMVPTKKLPNIALGSFNNLLAKFEIRYINSTITIARIGIKSMPGLIWTLFMAIIVSAGRLMVSTKLSRTGASSLLSNFSFLAATPAKKAIIRGIIFSTKGLNSLTQSPLP